MSVTPFFPQPSEIVVNPPTYISVANFKAMANDYDLTSYTDQQILDLLCRASGTADSIMRRSLLCKERTELMQGTGGNVLTLGVRPIAYVRLMQFVQPGLSGYIIPMQNVIVDALKGEIIQYSPLALQYIGLVSEFPRGVQIAVTYGVGYGRNLISAPSWTHADTSLTGLGLTPGSYTIGISTKTQWGETLPNFQSVTTSTGAVLVTVTPSIGAIKYPVYLASGAMTTTTGALAAGATTVDVADASAFSVGQSIVIDPAGTPDTVTISAIAGNVLTTSAIASAHASGVNVAPQAILVAEIPATTFGYSVPITATVSSSTTPTNYFLTKAPTSDTSPLNPPYAVIEAVRLLALGMLWEQNNLANRGIYTLESGRKRTTWKSTEGNSGKGVSYMKQQAEALLEPFKYRGVL